MRKVGDIIILKRYPQYHEYHPAQILDRFEVISAEAWDSISESKREIMIAPSGICFCKRIIS